MPDPTVPQQCSKAAAHPPHDWRGFAGPGPARHCNGRPLPAAPEPRPAPEHVPQRIGEELRRAAQRTMQVPPFARPVLTRPMVAGKLDAARPAPEHVQAAARAADAAVTAAGGPGAILTRRPASEAFVTAARTAIEEAIVAGRTSGRDKSIRWCAKGTAGKVAEWLTELSVYSPDAEPADLVGKLRDYCDAAAAARPHLYTRGVMRDVVALVESLAASWCASCGGPCRDESAPLNPATAASLARGLAQSAAGDVVDLGDFTRYTDEPDPEPTATADPTNALVTDSAVVAAHDAFVTHPGPVASGLRVALVAAVPHILGEAIASGELYPDLSGCPAYDGKGTCQSGCWQEPACQVDEPIGGWPAKRLAEAEKRGASAILRLVADRTERQLATGMPLAKTADEAMTQAIDSLRRIADQTERDGMPGEVTL